MTSGLIVESGDHRHSLWAKSRQSTQDDLDLLEPIAIIGFAFKFPQDATSSAKLWNILERKTTTMTEVPKNRFNIDTRYHPSKRGSLPVRGGNFLKQDISCFDTEFFGINPAEAMIMDPAQRILLETSYHAFEVAGLRLEDLKGSNTSVHTGCFTSDYMQQLLSDPERPPTYSAIGGNLSMLSNRLSWFYDLKGPSVNLDSACSSSAMAIDQACQILRSGDTRLSIVAGCNLTIDPNFTNLLANMDFLSKESRSYPFDSRANGYARGEGVGVVLLQTLNQALKDGNIIRGVIRASGSNQDGRTSAITQPNSVAQMQLIKETYRKAGLTLKHTRFFEAHGTGTAVGDPIEASAIDKVFSQYRDRQSPLYIGALKSNIGHLEGASGIAAVIKTILMLEKGVIVPNANFVKQNPEIANTNACMSFPSSCLPWPSSSSGIRRASINCFGYGGSNCHLILDDALSFLRHQGLSGRHNTSSLLLEKKIPAITSHENASGLTQSTMFQMETNRFLPRVFVWSAATEGALRTMINEWQLYYAELRKHSEPNSICNDLAYTLDTHRTRLLWRSYAVISSVDDLNNLASKSSAGMQCSNQSPRLAFVFTGQGAQWFAMGRDLLRYRRFTEVIDEAEDAFKDFGCTWSLRNVFLQSETKSQINKPQFAQPLCAVLQIGIIDLLQDAGIRPYVVVGHSMGEIAAAYCTGAISRRAALRIAYFRGAYFAKVPERSSIQGGMMAVGLSADSIQPYFESVKAVSRNFNLTLACINSPRNVTVSGDVCQLELLQAELQTSSVFFRRLRVNAAYHSPQLNCIAQDCLKFFQNLDAGSPRNNPLMVSTVSGSLVSVKELRRPEYWIQNMLSPVEFSKAISCLCREHHVFGDEGAIDHIIEIGPHATLKMPIDETLQSLFTTPKILYDSVLYRGKPATETLLDTVGKLFSSGYQVDIRALNELDLTGSDHIKLLVNGPEYPFNHDNSYWYENQLIRNQRFRKYKHLPLLGSTSLEWNELHPQWRYCIRHSELPWLRDHRLDGRVVYPASAYISMALHAVSQQSDAAKSIRAYVLQQVTFISPVVPPFGSDDMETRLCLSPIDVAISSLKWVWQFDISASHGNDWAEICSGFVEVVYEQDADGQKVVLHELQMQLQNNRSRCNEKSSSQSIYETLERRGYQYGPAFQGMSTVQHSYDEIAITNVALDLPCSLDDDHQDYIIHPTALDSFIQLSLVASLPVTEIKEPLYVPTSIEKLWISADGISASRGYLKSSARTDKSFHRSKSFSLFALNEEENSVRIIMKGLKLSAVDNIQNQQMSHIDALRYAYQFRDVVDIDMLDVSETYQWLDQQCGPDVEGVAEFWEDLRVYIHQTLSKLQVPSDHPGAFNDDQKHLSRYISWSDWQLALKAHPEVSIAVQQAIESRIVSRDGVGKLIVEVARNIREILAGKINILQLLFENDLVKNFYQDQALGSIYMYKLETYIRQVALKWPRMDILEIGGGTGSFTKHILKALESIGDGSHYYNEYTFTDISPMFFEAAKRQFTTHSHQMVFQKLDIDVDFAAQGYKESSYDLIVASNVLHVTPDISVTIAAIRKLLKPGGKLLLHEAVVPDSLEIGFAFGLIPGWWNGTESYRSKSPLIIEDKWVTILSENDFATPMIIMRDFKDEESHHMSVICASAIESREVPNPATHLKIIINCESISETALASSIEQTLSNGTFATSVSYLLPASREDIVSDLTIFLIDTVEPFFSVMDKERFDALKVIMMSAKRVLWITGGAGNDADPAFGMINGFSEVLRTEFPTLEISILALDITSFDTHTLQESLQHIKNVLRQRQLSRNHLNHENYTVANGKLTIRRLSLDVKIADGVSDLLRNQKTKIQVMETAKPFTLKTRQSNPFADYEIFSEATDSSPLSANEVEIDIRAVSLNQADSHHHHHHHHHHHKTGFHGVPGAQGSGVVKAVADNLWLQPGDRVCFWHQGSLRSTVRARANLVTRIPENVSFYEAASLPKDCLLASFILGDRARLGVNDSILVLARGSGLSRAVIEHALKLNNRVHVATFADQDKQTLKQLFPPHLSIHAVQGGFEELHCQQISFDIILDLSGKAPQLDILGCVSEHGQIVRIDVSDQQNSSRFFRFHGNLTYCTMTEESILSKLPDLPHISLSHAIKMSYASSSYSASPIQTFSLSKVSDAFNYLSTNSDSQAIVDFEHDEFVKVIRQGSPRFNLSTDSTYVLVGGFGDLGRCFARWMVARGARHLLFISRSGPNTEAAYQMIDEFKESNVFIAIIRCNISDRQSLQSNLQEWTAKMPPIKGCIQASGVLKDVMYEQMDLTDWQVAVDPKSRGSWNLHDLLPLGMDFFILIASAMGIVGQATQANYAAGNTYEDALARYRVAHGEKALSLDLGILLTGGLVAQSPDLVSRLTSSKHYIPMSEEEIWLLIELCCDPSFQRQSDVAPQIMTGIRSPIGCSKIGVQIKEFMKYPIWRSLHPTKSALEEGKPAHLDVDISVVLMKEDTLAAASAAAVRAIVQRLAAMVLIDESIIDPEQTLLDNDIDSLCAIELRNWILNNFGIQIPMFDLLGGSNITQLGHQLAKTLRDGLGKKSSNIVS